MYLISKTQIFNSENNVLLAPTSKIYKMINSENYSFLVTDINGVDYTCVLLETAHKNTIASPFVCGDLVYEMIVKFCAFNGLPMNYDYRNNEIKSQ